MNLKDINIPEDVAQELKEEDQKEANTKNKYAKYAQPTSDDL